MKFAKSMYSNFENSKIGLKNMIRGSVFAVTPEIEESKVYQDGVATKNFVPVEVKNMRQFREVVNITESVSAEFMGTQSTPIPEVAPVVEEAQITFTDVTIVPEEVPEELIDEVLEEPVEEELPQEDEEIIDVDSMKYYELQDYAKELEEKYNIQLDRGSKKALLLAEIKAVIEEHA